MSRMGEDIERKLLQKEIFLESQAQHTPLGLKEFDLKLFLKFQYVYIVVLKKNPNWILYVYYCKYWSQSLCIIIYFDTLIVNIVKLCYTFFTSRFRKWCHWVLPLYIGPSAPTWDMDAWWRPKGRTVVNKYHLGAWAAVCGVFLSVFQRYQLCQCCICKMIKCTRYMHKYSYIGTISNILTPTLSDY